MIDIRNLPRKKMNNLGRQYSFHKLNIKDYLLKTPIPKIDKYNNHIFVILYFPTKSNDDKIPRVTRLLTNTIYGMDISLPRSQLIITIPWKKYTALILVILISIIIMGIICIPFHTLGYLNRRI